MGNVGGALGFLGSCVDFLVAVWILYHLRGFSAGNVGGALEFLGVTARKSQFVIS